MNDSRELRKTDAAVPPCCALDPLVLAQLDTLTAAWRERVDADELSARSAAHLVALGAAHPNDAPLRTLTHHPDLVLGSRAYMRIVLDDEELSSHDLTVQGTVAQTLGAGVDPPAACGRLLTTLPERTPA